MNSTPKSLHSTAMSYWKAISILSGYLEEIIKNSTKTAYFEQILSTTMSRILKISRLGVIGALINFPFDSISQEKIPNFVQLFLSFDEKRNDLNTTIEQRLANMNRTSLIHYIKAVACFIRKIKFDGEFEAENMINVAPLLCLLYQVFSKEKIKILNPHAVGL